MKKLTTEGKKKVLLKEWSSWSIEELASFMVDCLDEEETDIHYEECLNHQTIIKNEKKIQRNSSK